MTTSGAYPKPESFDDLLRRCQDVVDYKSRGFVEDAVVFARWILVDGREMLANLTATQKRCTDLLERCRLLSDHLRVIAAARGGAREDALTRALACLGESTSASDAERFASG